MTEEVQATDQPVTESNVAPQEVTSPHMVEQTKVNELVGAAKQKGYQKALEELQATQQMAQQPQAAAPTLGGMPQSLNDIEALVDQRMTQLQQQQMQQQQEAVAQAEAQRILSELAVKTESAKKRYEDFDTKVGSISGAFEAAPQLLHYANSVDNAGDILYDLANNPTKIANLKQLGDINPQLALMEVQKLSESIKQNQNPAPTPASPDSLRQVKTSNVGMDSGKPSIRDFKAKYRG